MKILKKIGDLENSIRNVSSLGFVPTMGSIHKGHISLIKESKKKAKKTIVSIFVNPLQFNNKNDFVNYPRNIKKDLIVLKKLKVNFLYLPNKNEILKIKKKNNFKLSKIDKILCAKHRKKHFEGVLKIVHRFLKIIKPKYVFLGEKDFQQFFLINKYLGKIHRCKIIKCKTIRDKNFVALSSRNSLLPNKYINIAGRIAKMLNQYKSSIINKKNNLYEIDKFKKNLLKKFKIKIDYLELRNENNLKFYNKKKKFRLFIAYYINNIRLIDNF
tara:strand:- start:1366 stop:2178 length:813 start_codon:yes stop_codon:yes gene_type:complete